MALTLPCRGFAGAPCSRRVLGFGGRCHVHARQYARVRAVEEMRELRGLCPREERRQDEDEPRGDEDADGWAGPGFVEIAS